MTIIALLAMEQEISFAAILVRKVFISPAPSLRLILPIFPKTIGFVQSVALRLRIQWRRRSPCPR
jgi:hypothetical protein